MQKQTKEIGWKLRIKFIEQLYESLIFLHDKKKLVHRDVRITNLFLDENLNLKIGDFGIGIIEGVEISSTYSNLQYVGKGIYGSGEEMGSRYLIDIRFFGIILLKLLHYVSQIDSVGEDEELYKYFPDWCPEFYKLLVSFCIAPKMTHLSSFTLLWLKRSKISQTGI